MYISAHDLVIPAEGKGLVKTDVALAVPPGYYGRVGKKRYTHVHVRESRYRVTHTHMYTYGRVGTG